MKLLSSILLSFVLSLFSIICFGQNNYSLNFDGVDDYAQLSSSTNFGSNSFTISIDCKLNNYGENEYENYSYVVGVPIKGIYNEQGFKIQTTSQNSIYGTDGFAMHIGEIVLRSENFNNYINISSLATGVYFLNINHSKGFESIRFVKQ